MSYIQPTEDEIPDWYWQHYKTCNISTNRGSGIWIDEPGETLHQCTREHWCLTGLKPAINNLSKQQPCLEIKWVGEHIKLKPGDLLLIPPIKTYKQLLRGATSRPVMRIQLEVVHEPHIPHPFSPLIYQSAVRLKNQQNYEVEWNKISELKYQTGSNLHDKGLTDVSHLKLNALVQNLLIAYIEDGFADGSIQISQQTIPDMVEKVQSIIRTNYRDAAFRLSTLAVQCGTSQRTLSRMFLKFSGVTPSQYLHHIRIKAAQRLLLKRPD